MLCVGWVALQNTNQSNNTSVPFGVFRLGFVFSSIRTEIINHTLSFQEQILDSGSLQKILGVNESKGQTFRINSVAVLLTLTGEVPLQHW